MLKVIEKFKPLTRFRIALVLALLGMLPVIWSSSAALVPGGGSGDPATVLVFVGLLVAEWAAITVLVQASATLSAVKR